MKKGLLIVISAPSGAGKTTICRDFLKRNPCVRYAISTTTRSPRDGEKEGIDYYFTNPAQFEKMIEESAFLEYAKVYNNYYGTSKYAVMQNLEKGFDVLVDVDTQGAASIRKIYPESVQIFILPPSIEVLKQRLMDRAKDSPDVIDLRLSKAKEEISEAKYYKYIIINDQVESAVANFTAIIMAEKLLTVRNGEIIEKFLL